MAKKRISKPITVIHTDGSCLTHTGIGGWAAHIEESGHVVTISGSCRNTTNNAMELFAVIAALKELKSESRILLFSDSQYVVNIIMKWIYNWSKNNWCTAKWKGRPSNPVKNKELLQELLLLLNKHDVQAYWVEGHAGHPINELVDNLARSEARRIS